MGYGANQLSAARFSLVRISICLLRKIVFSRLNDTT